MLNPSISVHEQTWQVTQQLNEANVDIYNIYIKYL